MESNRSDGRSNWKQAVRKENPSESRIFGANRELPNKFSPARLANNEPTSKSLIKNRSNNYSHDEFAITAILGESRERSNSRDNKLEKKVTFRTLPPQPDEESLGKPRESINIIATDRQKGSLKRQDLDVVRQLKLQFLRFKERVLKELRRQEEELKATILQIYQRVETLQNCSESPVPFRSSPVSLKLNQLALASPREQTLQSPISKYLQTLKRQSSQAEPSNKQKGDIAVSSLPDFCTPHIKASMGRFSQLLSSLKEELNQQFPMKSESRRNLQCDT